MQYIAWDRIQNHLRRVSVCVLVCVCVRARELGAEYLENG